MYRGSLEQALWISRLNEREKGDPGESARIMNQLSRAYLANGEQDRGVDMRENAYRINQTLKETGEYTYSDDEDMKWDYLVCLKFR